MRVWAALALLGLVLVAGFLRTRADLRGWTPADWSDPAAQVTPTHAAHAPFTVGDCLPGTIDAHAIATARDGAGTASMTVLTCRSRSSAWRIVLAYLLAALAYPALCLVAHARRARR